MKALAILVALVMLPTDAIADSATAAAAFRQGEALAKQGKWADACPLFEASFQADQQLGVLLYLADCHERVGRTATAFAEFNDAVDMARTRGDKREGVAQKRADALKPKLAKLTLTAPKKLIPGLTVKRGNIDITVLVGSEIPIDPGEHAIVASAPGYVEWRHKVTIAPNSTSALEIPDLDRVVDKPVDAPIVKTYEGTLKITTLPTAQIILDNEVVGTGTWEGKVKSGGHTLRVVAGGMRPYQTEVVVGDNESRTIDVPLEKEFVAGPPIIFAPPPEDRPSFELAVGLLSGVKARNENPMIVAIRAELALRLGRRVIFGFYAEYGGIDTAVACGFDMAGPMPATPIDFGPRNQFTKCNYFMPGLQLLVRILPESRFDPYIGLAPGFRFGFVEWTPFLGGAPQDPKSELFLAIVSGIRAGLDYHPKPGLFGWQVGAYFETSIAVLSDEVDDANRDGPAGPSVSFLGGVRTSLAF